MKILFKYPTRQRPLMFSKTLMKYYELMKNNNFEFLISCDNDDESMNSKEIKDFLQQFPNLSIRYDNNKTKIDAVNCGVSEKNFDIVVLVSDDMIPEVEGYDEIIRNDMKSNFPDTDGGLWYFDGWNKKICTLSILGKKLYDRFNYIYHPSYKTQWCDNEYTEVTQKMNKLYYSDCVIIRHVHPDIVLQNMEAKNALYSVNEVYKEHNFAGHDLLWQKNADGNEDENNFLKRKSKGFQQ